MPGLTGFYFSYNFLLSKLEISSDASLVSMEADSPNVLFFFWYFPPEILLRLDRHCLGSALSC